MHDQTSRVRPSGVGQTARLTRTDAAVHGGRPPTAYLLTDIDGSTQKLERAREEMKRAQARHDEIIRDSVAQNGGFIRDWAGDGAFAIFHGGEPLKCALEIQRALQMHNWDAVGGLLVRIGVHCTWDGSHDLDKASVHRAARIRDSAWGGQILLSSAASAALSSPPGSQLIDQGLCRLKGVDAPMRLFGLVDSTLTRREFPPPRTASARGLGIPAPTSPIYGREDELASIVGQLNGAVRQLTIVGPGGNGKTRLAMEVATQSLDAMAVYYAPLAAAANPQDLVAALAQALCLPFHGGAPREAQLTEYLRDKCALILLDNADRLAGQCAFLDALLASCADVRLLATSRAPLLLDGETVVRLHGLRSPARRDPSFRSTPAYLLFVQEARKTQPAFDIADQEAPTFSEICDMLGGSPLAINLAAQWTHLLPLEDIRRKLRDGPGFLTELHGEQQRQRLEGIFDGSWALLDSAQQGALARLSVFEGGFDRHAAEGVAQVDIAMLGVLERMSLLERHAVGRFAMHPLIHECARDRLARAPDDLRSKIRRRHAEYFLAMVCQCFLAARNAEQSMMLDQVERDLSNIRTAWSHTADVRDAARLRDTAEPIFYTFVLRALFHDCASLFEAHVDDPGLRCHLLSLRANCLAHQGDYNAAETLSLCALKEPACETRAAAHCRHALANIAHARGELGLARSLYHQALADRARLDDGMGSYFAAISLALLELQADDIPQVRRWVKESARLCHSTGHLGGMLFVHRCAGDIAVREGRAASALASYRKAAAISESVRQPQPRAMTLVKLGTLCLEQGAADEAYASFEEACEIADAIGDRRIAVNAGLGLARTLRINGELAAAKEAVQAALSRARALASHTQLAAALVELARVELALGEDAAAVRIAALLRHLKLERPSPDCEALVSEFGSTIAKVDDLDAALLELINEPVFGVLDL